MLSDLEKTADRIRRHPKLVIADDFEIALQESTQQGARFHDGECISRSQTKRLWISLRILHRKRGGKSVTVSASPDSIQTLVESAFESANRSMVDPWFRFPIWKAPVQAAVDIGEEKLEFALQRPHVSAECSFFDESYEAQTVRTYLRRKTERNVLTHATRVHRAALALAAGEGDDFVFLKEDRLRRTPWTDHDEWVRELAQTALSRKVRPAKAAGRGKRRVVIAPRVAARILKALAPWFSAEAVKEATSPLSDEARRTWGSALTLVDDGREPNDPFSAPFDLEGASTGRTILVDKGQVKNWLFDVHSATRENRLSTGNFLRPLSEPFPRIAHSALSILPGEISRQTLLEQMSNGIYLDCLEAFEADPANPAHFYLRGSGWKVAFGQCSEPLRGVEWEGDLRDLLRGAVAVARDLAFFDRLGSPSILLEEVPLGC